MGQRLATVVMATVATLGLSIGLGAAPAGAAPAAPVLSQPIDGAETPTNPVLGWTPVAGAVRYNVQVSTQQDFASGTVKFTQSTANTFATPPTDLAVGKYWWRVSALDSSSTTGPYTTSTFMKATAAAPAPRTPASGATLNYPNDALVLSWDPLPGATSYEVQIDDDEAFVGAANPVSTTNSSYTPAIPPFGTSVYWRVRAKSAQGIPTQYSVPRSYRVVWPEKVSSDPTKRFPANTTSPTVEEVVLNWEPLAGASAYELQISPDQFFNAPIGGTQVVNSTSYSPSPTLPAASYYWRVRGLNTAQVPEPGPWSDVWVFTRAWPASAENSRPRGTETTNDFAQVKLISPADADYTRTEPTFSWAPQRGASMYEFQVGTDPNFSPNTYNVCFTNHTTISPYQKVQPLTLKDCVPNTPVSSRVWPGTVLYWKVRALDDLTDFSPNPKVNGVFSEIRSFLYDPSLVKQVAPVNGATVPVPVLRWEPVDNISHYKVTISPVTSITGCVAVTAITYNPTYVPETISDKCTGPLRWAVQSQEEDGDLSRLPHVSTWPTFTISPPPSGASMGTVTTTDFDGIHPPLMQWTPVTSATKYVVAISVTGAGSYSPANAGTNQPAFAYTGENTTLPDMLSPGSYDFFVSAYDKNGFLLDTSAVQQFRITGWPKAELLTPKCNVGVVCTLHDTPRLDWMPMANMGLYRVYIATDPNFTNIIREWQTAFSELTPVESLPDSQAGESYYWYVRPCYTGSTCAPFDTSVFADAGVFRKESLPVKGLSPKVSAGTTPVVADEVTFTWTDYLATNYPLNDTVPAGSAVKETVSQEARAYEVQVSNTAEFTNIIETSPRIDQTTYTAQTKTYPDGPLYWRVRAYDASDNPLTYSCAPGTQPRVPQPACSEFAFEKKSAAPTLLLPTHNAAVDSAPTTTWAPMPYAETYQVEVYSHPESALNPTNRVVSLTTRGTAAIATTPLPKGDYGWRVRRLDVNDRPGAWTTETNAPTATSPGLQLFTVEGPKPMLTNPGPGADVGEGGILLEWAPVVGASRYRVEVSSDGFGSVLESATTDMTAWAPDLLLKKWPAGSYSWRVTTLDSTGAALATSETRAFTVQTPPAAPSAVNATPGNAQATVTWTAPATTGGSTIIGYTVTASPGGATATTSGATSAIVTGLTNGTGYTFTVVATNSLGTSVASTPSNRVTPAAPPAAPTGVTATSGNSQATVSWTAPTADGGSAITGYTITASPGGKTVTTGSWSSSTIVTGLTNGTAYTFTVQAANAAGTSAASTPSNTVVPQGPASAPGAPTSVTATAGNAQATVSWSPPTNNGGSAITKYTVTSSPGFRTATTSGATSATVTGLTNGTSYTFTVTATNGVGTSMASAPSNAVTPKASVAVRWAGADRFASSATFSAKSFPAGVNVAYIANGLNFPDALSGAPIAGMNGGPVLLVTATAIPTPIATELKRLQPKKIVVLGGTGAVSSTVQTKLDAYTTGPVERWAGANRFASSAMFSAKSFPVGVSVAYVANGLNFPDALSGAPIAGKTPGPVLLTGATSLPGPIATELKRLQPKSIVVLGGTGMVSTAVQNQLAAYTSGTVDRWAGANRFASSAQFSAKSYPSGVGVVYVANGLNFPDALSGAPIAGKNKGPVLLTSATSLPAPIITELQRLRPKSIIVLGGTGMVSTAVQTQLGGYIG